jgi:cell division septation protein DedD
MAKGLRWLTRFGLFLLCLSWIFALGIMVGRGSLRDNPIGEKAISELEKGLTARMGHREPLTITEIQAENDGASLAARSLSSERDPWEAAQPERPGPMARRLDAPPPYPPQRALGLQEGAVQTYVMTSPSSKAAETEIAEAAEAEEPSASPPKGGSIQPQAPERERPSGPEAGLGKNGPADGPIDRPADRPAGAASSLEETPDPGYWPARPLGSGKFTVQLASPTDRDEARRLVESWQKKGFQAYYYPSGSRFPVRSGRFETEAEAFKAKEGMEAAGARNPYVSKLND